MNKLIIVENKDNYERFQTIYAEKIENLFKWKLVDKVYLIFLLNDKIEECYCKFISQIDYKENYLQHLTIDNDFSFSKTEKLKNYLIGDFNNKDYVEILYDAKYIDFINLIMKELKTKEIKSSLIGNL